MTLKTLVRTSLFLLVAIGVSGCAAGSGQAGVNADVLTRADLMETPSQTVYEIVRQRRPAWLRTRRQSNVTGVGQELDPGQGARVEVYVNGSRLQGGVDDLQQYLARDVQEVRHLDAIEATSKYGTGNTSGVIEVTMMG